MALQQNLVSQLIAIINGLINFHNNQGPKRYYAQLFRDLPDRNLYPDYYTVIKQPRALNFILQAVRKNVTYDTVADVGYDLVLVFANAKEYNEEGSQVFRDAEKLESYLESLWDERSPPLPPFSSIPKPTREDISYVGGIPLEPVAPPIKKIKLSTKPPPVEEFPSTKISLNLNAPPPTTPQMTVKLGGSRVYTESAASTPLAHPAPSSYSDYGTPQPPGNVVSIPLNKFDTIPDSENGWLQGEANPEFFRSVLRAIKEQRDGDRVLSKSLASLPDASARSEYYANIKEPVSLDIIEGRISAYISAEHFDQDMAHLFRVAQLVTKRETPAFGDVLFLSRLYNELTKNFSRPVFKAHYTAPELASVAAGPTNIMGATQRALLTASSAITAMTPQGKGIANSRVTLKDKIFLDGINFKGTVIRVGDWVHLFNPDNPAKPIIAQVFKTYRRPESTQRCISTCWYYRPEETVHQESRQFYEDEVFKTSNFVDHHVEDFVDKCFVMFFTRFVRGRPREPLWTPETPLYVCEHRYKDDMKSFKKIKNWNSCVPEEIRRHEYEFVPFANDRVDVLRRVKSPFLRGIKGPGGIGDPLEKEEEEQQKYHGGGLSQPHTSTRKPYTISSMSASGQQKMQAQGHSAPSQPYFSRPIAAHGHTQHSQHPQHSLHPQHPQHPPHPPQPPAPLAGAPPAPAVSWKPTTPGASPAQLMATSLKMKPIPELLTSPFRQTGDDLIWFTSPSKPPFVNDLTALPVSHSVEYLVWKQAQAP